MGGRRVDGVYTTAGGLSLLSPQCPLYLCPELDAFEGDNQALELGLAGAHQRSNAALALQLARTWLQRRGHQGKVGAWGQGWIPPWPSGSQRVTCPPPGLGEVQEVLPGTELVGRPVPLAPTFQPTDAMIQGAVWPGREPPPCQRDLGGVTPGYQPVLPVLGGTAWLPVPLGSRCWRGVPVLEGGPSHALCPPPQGCGTRSGWAGPRCCPMAP